MAVPVGWDFDNNPAAWAMNSLPLMRSDNEIYGWSPGVTGKTTRRANKRRRSYPPVSTRGNNLRPELKFHDFPQGFTLALQSGGVFTSINLIDQGDGSQERVGMRFNVKSISLNFGITMDQRVGTSASNYFRVILFVDHQANGDIPGNLEVLTQSTSVFSQHNPFHSHRFTFLHDKVYTITAPSMTWNGSATISQSVRKSVSIFKRVNVPIFYDAASKAIENVTQNNIIMMIYAEALTPAMHYSGTSRLRFTDL